MTVMNPKLDTYFLHSLHGQFFRFHFLMPFLKVATLNNSFESKGTKSQILGPKYEIPSIGTKYLWKTDLTFCITKSELIRKLQFISRRSKVSLKMGGHIFRYTLNISVANICIFLMCVKTDLSCSNSFSKDDDLSPYNRRRHLSCRRLVLIFMIRLWNIQIRGQ